MENTKGKELKQKLCINKKVGWDDLKEGENEAIFRFADEYMYYLNQSKTEKEIIKTSKEILIKNGFVDISEKEVLHPGDKVFFINKDRNVYAAVIGEGKLVDGFNMIAAHADSPRIDLKPKPLYEDSEIALFKTHYYGGIKKYQWTNIPLALHGLAVRKNGEKVNIVIGEENEDPIFTISDLLPHLAREQMQKKLSEGVEGEELNILVGTIPYEDEEVSERVKLNILNILYEKYGLTEEDLVSSEMEFVPAFKARSLGFDSSMVAAYGQDDKICCYTALRGIIEIDKPQRTAICVLTDREEVGFDGVTGMFSQIFDTFVAELLNKTNENFPNALQKTFMNSKALSADVDAAYNPSFSYAFEKNNTAYLGKGITLVKYTGAGGKSGSSEAPAEFMAEVRRVFERAEARYQAGELGRVDKGGGGTIALTLANRGINVVDAGVPVMGMHSPYEITSKYDVYQAFKGYREFYKG